MQLLELQFNHKKEIIVFVKSIYHKQYKKQINNKKISTYSIQISLCLQHRQQHLHKANSQLDSVKENHQPADHIDDPQHLWRDLCPQQG